MPRNISAEALAKLSDRYGVEPITVIEISWAGDGRTAYADRDIAGVAKGSILEVSGLDDIIKVSGGSSSQAITIKLDDTDGAIKAIIDAYDIHKRTVWVYQWFDGLDIADKFLVFRGQINTPQTHDEGDRTFTFDVVSTIEDVEVGFSIDEGNFIDPPENLIGKPWPLCFGTVVNVPALRIIDSAQGTLAQGTGIRDFTLEERIRLAQKLICPLNFQGFQVQPGVGTLFAVVPIYEPDPSCLKGKCETIESLQLQYAEQGAYQTSPVIIFGGEKFKQGVPLTLDINGGKFTGKFTGNSFAITGRIHPDNDGHNHVKLTDTQNTIKSACPGTDSDVDPNSAEFTDPNGISGSSTTLEAAKSRLSFEQYNAVKPGNFFWANAGDKVTLSGAEKITYIVNLLPSTILRVAAYRTLPNGGRQLLTVPDSYYSIWQVDYVGYTGVMELVFNTPLSRQDLQNGGGWDDEIFVTFVSSVGPNTVDILEWFIGTYTQYATDSASFDAVRDLIDNYPMHFALLERKNIIRVLEEIAYQVRCALFLRDSTFYLKYLAADPAIDETITESDIIANTLKLDHTPTEDLVTKHVAEWKSDYALDKPNALTLRRNVKKYGTHEQTYNYYCFSMLELVRKASTFWLIRKANTWRKLSFKTHLHKLKLETFDTASVRLDYLGPGDIKCIVEAANYNSDDHSIDFQVWTPCKAGTNFADTFAFPADIEETLLYPTIEDQALGFAGSGHEPNFSVIAPLGHPLYNDKFGLYGNAQGTRSDQGGPKPSDRGDSKPTPQAPSGGDGQINVGTSPIATAAAVANCCSESNAKAEAALKEAQAARKEAQTAAAQGGQASPKSKTFEEAMKDLPDQTERKNCQAVGTLDKIKVTLVHKKDGSNGDKPGDTGKLLLGDYKEAGTLYANSAEMLKELKAKLLKETEDLSEAYGIEVGGTYWHTTSQASPDLGTDSENSGICQEPPIEQRAITGGHGWRDNPFA